MRGRSSLTLAVSVMLTLIGSIRVRTAFVQAPAFRSRTDLVAIYATVLRDGRALTGLSRDSFVVREDGRPRPIDYFVAEQVPVSLMLALDVSESMKGERFEFARHAVDVFADSRSSDDQLAVIGFNDEPFSIAPWGSSREAMAAALEALTPSGHTALFDAVSASLPDLRSATNRRQALVIISDGNDFRASDISVSGPERKHGDVTLEDLRSFRERPVLDRLRRSEVIVYAIGVDSFDAPTTPDKRFDVAALERLTDRTGGFTQVVRSAEQVPQAAQVIRDQLDHQYLIGFIPEHANDGKFHRIQLTIPGCRCTIRARTGFFADASRDGS